MKLSVLVPSYNRPLLLNETLLSLAKQVVLADEVIVVLREDDTASQNVAKSFSVTLPLKILLTSVPGVIHAENLAMSNATSDLIAFIDDDATAPSDWIKKIKEHLSKPHVLGVGGPDFIVKEKDPAYPKFVTTIGKITWYGRVIGNHHQRATGIHTVQVLKGVNMAFKKEVLTLLDTNLQSEHNTGNGSHWELDLCFFILKNHQGVLLFDSSLIVNHFSDHSHFIKYTNIKNNARNLLYVMLKNLSLPKKISFLCYLFFIGNNQIYGLAKVGTELFLQRKPKELLLSCLHSTIGALHGFTLYLNFLKRN